MPGFQSFLKVFLQHFVSVKLATSSIKARNISFGLGARANTIYCGQISKAVLEKIHFNTPVPHSLVYLPSQTDNTMGMEIACIVATATRMKRQRLLLMRHFGKLAPAATECVFGIITQTFPVEPG